MRHIILKIMAGLWSYDKKFRRAAASAPWRRQGASAWYLPVRHLGRSAGCVGKASQRIQSSCVGKARSRQQLPNCSYQVFDRLCFLCEQPRRQPPARRGFCFCRNFGREFLWRRAPNDDHRVGEDGQFGEQKYARHEKFSPYRSERATAAPPRSSRFARAGGATWLAVG